MITVGARAAAKVLVQAARAILIALALTGTAAAQTRRRLVIAIVRSRSPTTRSWWRKPSTRKRTSFRTSSVCCSLATHGRPASPRSGRWAGRPISCPTRSDGWMPATNVGFGDALVNYRYQAMEEGPGRPAFSPRISADDAVRERAARAGRGLVADCRSICRSASRRATGTGTGTRASPGCRRRIRRHARGKPRVAVRGWQRDLPRAADVQRDARERAALARARRRPRHISRNACSRSHRASAEAGTSAIIS